jgi:hypothetical protein
MLSRLASADRITSPNSSPLTPSSARARSHTDILHVVQNGSSSDLELMMSNSAFDRSSFLHFDNARGTPLAAAFAAENWEAAELLLRHGAAQSIFVRGAAPRSLWCTLPQAQQPPSSRFGSQPPPPPLTTTPASVLRTLDGYLLKYLDSVAPLRSSMSPLAAPLPPMLQQHQAPKTEISTCGVDQALTKSFDGGFSFSSTSPNETEVHFGGRPGAILFTNVIVGKSASTSARFSFIPQQGRSRLWGVGVIPESRQSDLGLFLKVSGSGLGWANNGPNAKSKVAAELNRAESQSLVCTVSVDSALCELTLEVDGAVVDKLTLQPSVFPLRLGMCGVDSTRIRVIPAVTLSSPTSTLPSILPDSFQIGDCVCLKPLVPPPPITKFESKDLRPMVQESLARGVIVNMTSSRCMSNNPIANLAMVHSYQLF